MLATSWASLSRLPEVILRPVRIGMSYTMTGRSVAEATASMWATMPAWDGRL
jgi:hypothetical protein